MHALLIWLQFPLDIFKNYPKKGFSLKARMLLVFILFSKWAPRLQVIIIDSRHQQTMDRSLSQTCLTIWWPILSCMISSERFTANLLTFATRRWSKPSEFPSELQVIPLDISKTFNRDGRHHGFTQLVKVYLRDHFLHQYYCLWKFTTFNNIKIYPQSLYR